MENDTKYLVGVVFLGFALLMSLVSLGIASNFQFKLDSFDVGDLFGQDNVNRQHDQPEDSHRHWDRVTAEDVLANPVVINLDRSPDRLDHFNHVMLRAGVRKVERFRAIDGRDAQSMGIVDALGLSRLRSSNGQIGCSLSHYHLWCRVAYGRHKGILIFEDDALPRSDLKTALAEAMKDIHVPYDMLLLGNQIDKSEAGQEPLKVTFQPTFCLHAYYITQQGARHLLKLLSVYQQKKQYAAIDIFIIEMARKGFFRMCSIVGSKLPMTQEVAAAVEADGPAWEARDGGIVFQNARFKTVIGD